MVPEVYWIITGSSGVTAGSLMLSSSPAAMNASQSSKQMISRSSGQFGSTACTVSSIGLPRKLLTTKMPAERDCFSTYCTSSGAKGRVDGDEHHARHAGAEFEHHPFREVLRPDGDALAWLEAGQQRAGGALRLRDRAARRSIAGAVLDRGRPQSGRGDRAPPRPPCARGRQRSSPAPQASSGLRRVTSSMSSNPPRSGDGAVIAAGVSIVPGGKMPSAAGQCKRI